MGWFLTLTSKMTGYRIPGRQPLILLLLLLLLLPCLGIGMAPGGQIHQDREEVAVYLEDMETVADAMAADKYWDRPQVRLHISWIHILVLPP